MFFLVVPQHDEHVLILLGALILHDVHRETKQKKRERIPERYSFLVWA
jgi:hypothetical protein